MPVFCHNKISIGNYGTIHKLVVVRVRCNQIPMVTGIDKHDIWRLTNNVDYHGSNCLICLYTEYLLILLKNICGNA